MSPQLRRGSPWHCDVRPVLPLRVIRGDSGFGQVWMRHALGQRDKAFADSIVAFLCTCCEEPTQKLLETWNSD